MRQIWFILWALGCWTLNAATPTFYWSMESDEPDIYPEGSDSTPGSSSGGPPAQLRSTAQAHSGEYSLDLSASAWLSNVFDNPTNDIVWASPDEGAMEIWFYYEGAFPGSAMLMMITGKAQKTAPELDSNDGISLRFHGTDDLRMGAGWKDANGQWNTTTLRYKHPTAFEPNQWHRVRAKWNRAGPETLWLQVNDQSPVTSTATLGPFEVQAWHQLLIGNDRVIDPEALYIDDVRIWDSFDNIEYETSEDQAYLDWAEAMGLTPGVNDGPEDISTPGGKPNYFYFALDGQPGSMRHSALMVEHIQTDDGRWQFTVPVRVGATFGGHPLASASIDGLTYQIFGELDLQPPWGDLVLEETANPDGLPALSDTDGVNGPDWEYRSFRVSGSEGALDRAFFIVEVSFAAG